MGNTGPSALTPFVRSDAQGAVLAETLGHPENEVSISELSRRTASSLATTHREVQRLIRSGVLVERRDGNNRLVRANQEHPLFALMSQLVVETYGPQPVLRALLADVPGVVEAFVYGSWAARRTGTEGPFPRDIDVMVVGSLALDDLLDIQERARALLHREVNIHRTTVADWHSPDGNPFLTTVRSRPLVPLVGGEHE